MTTYAIEIKRCNKCSNIFKEYTTTSWNSFNINFYSDGYADHGADHALIKCPACESLFWRNELEVITKAYMPKHDEYNNIPSSLSITISEDDCEKAVNDEIWRNEEEEQYLRIRWWWESNSSDRSMLSFVEDDADSKMFFYGREKSVGQKESLLKLIELLDESRQDNIILKAEIYRELEMFDNCILCLDREFDTEYQVIVKTIADKAIAKNRFVFMI